MVTIILSIIGLLGAGGLGKTLMDRWSERDRLRAQSDGNNQSLRFTDNEQARLWLRAQLDEAEKELRLVRESERTLLARVGELAAMVARQEERTNAQAARIDDLSAAMTRLDTAYAKMETERDQYRQEKHDAENKLTPLTLRASMAERDLAAKDAEIARLQERLSQPRHLREEPPV